MNVNIPDNTDCPTCHELESTECIVHEDSLPALGLPSGSRLNTILKYINNKVKDFVSKFKKVIYNVTPIFDTGVPIFTYTDESCSTTPLNMNMPLFLNGKECFEYDVDEVTTDTFSVHAVMGAMTFYDSGFVEITDQVTIDALTALIVAGSVRPICCPDCNDLGASFTYSGEDVICGAITLATAGDTMTDILTNICTRIDTIGSFFNIFAPNDDGDTVNVFLGGNADTTTILNDQPLWVDRIGCSEDITVTIDSVDGILLGLSTTATILANNSVQIVDFTHPVGLAAGNYSLTLTWSGCGMNKVQNITLTLV